MRDLQTFAVRTVRGGRVRILGRDYRPRDEYHGELDGQRLAFGGYGDFWKHSVGSRPFVCLWGSEAQFRDDGDPDREDYPASPNVIDGVFHWEWWVADRAPTGEQSE